MSQYVPAEAAPRILQPLNPLDQLRLLWWLLAAPDQFNRWIQYNSEASVRQTLYCLNSTLFWLPLSIPLLGYALGTGPDWWFGPPEGVWLLVAAIPVMWWFYARHEVIGGPPLLLLLTGSAGLVLTQLCIVLALWLDDTLNQVPFVVLTVVILLYMTVVTALLMQTTPILKATTPGRHVPTLAGLVGIGVAVRLLGSVPTWFFLLLPLLVIALVRHFGGLLAQVIEMQLDSGLSSNATRQLTLWLAVGAAALVWLYLLNGWALFVV